MRYLLTIIIVLLAWNWNCAATLSREDKLRQNNLLLKSDPRNPELLKENGSLCLNLGRFSDAISYADRLMKLSHSRKDSLVLQANAHIISGQSYINMAMHREALQNLERGREIAERLKDHELISSAYNGLGIYYTQGRANPEQGIIYYNQALAHADTAGNEFRQAVALYNLGCLWLYRNNLKGKQYALEAFDKANSLSDTELAFQACTVLNGYAMLKGDIKEASSWLEKARAVIKDSSKLGSGTYLMAFEAENAESSKQYKKADSLYRICLSKIHELEPSMRTNLCTQYGRFLIQQKRVADGIRVFRKGLEEAKATNVAMDSAILMKRLAEAYHLAGDNETAYELLDRQMDLADRIRLRDENRSYMEYSVKTDLYLNQLQLERQRSQLLSKERNLILVIGLCLLLAVTCGTLFYSYRRKNSLYKSIVVQNHQTLERERILRERIEEFTKKREEDTAKSGQRSGTGSDEGLSELADKFAILMMEERLYENPELTVNTIAERLGTNRTYLSKAIKRASGHSVVEEISNYRIRRAAELLSDTNDTRPLKVIVASVGFSSMSTFYAAFRAQLGMTPVQYRKNAIEIAKDS